MSVYLDTSLIIAALVAERESERVVSWLEARADDLLASAWTAPEVASALSLKVRTGALDLSARAAAMARFNGLMSSLLILDIEPLHFLLAASFAGQHDLALRASDALHLAVCADRGASLATLDGRMRDAALALGVAVESI